MSRFPQLIGNDDDTYTHLLLSHDKHYGTQGRSRQKKTQIYDKHKKTRWCISRILFCLEYWVSIWRAQTFSFHLVNFSPKFELRFRRLLSRECGSEKYFSPFSSSIWKLNGRRKKQRGLVGCAAGEWLSLRVNFVCRLRARSWRVDGIWEFLLSISLSSSRLVP